MTAIPLGVKLHLPKGPVGGMCPTINGDVCFVSREQEYSNVISLHISNCITPQLRVGKQQKKSVYLFSVKFFFFTKDTLYILNYPFLKTPDF